MHWGLAVAFFCKRIDADGNVQQMFRIWANPSSNKLQSYKAKILSKPCQSRICSKGKTFFWWDCFCFWYLMVVDLAANADVDCRKDFSETERKLAAGSDIWKVQRRKLLFNHHQLSSTGFSVSTSLGFDLHLSTDWKRVKTSGIDKWEVFNRQRRLQLKSSKFMFPWILGVGTRSLIQEAPIVWPDHFENIFQPVLIPHCQRHNGVECFEQNNCIYAYISKNNNL